MSAHRRLHCLFGCLISSACRPLKCRNAPQPRRRYLPAGIGAQRRIVRFKHDDRGDGRGGKIDGVLSTTNGQYLEYLYECWKRDPNSVAPSWDAYFRTMDQDYAAPTGAAPKFPPQNARAKSAGDMQGQSFISGALDINAVIRAYQARGHLIADIDPLGIQNPDSHKLQGTPNLPPAIVVRQHLKGLTDADMSREFPLTPFTVIGGPKRSLPLKEILTRLNEVYCGHLGLEYTYIHDIAMLDWLREKFEVPGAWKLPEAHRKFIWLNIMRAVTFEGFLARKFPTEKRFGLEGCEAFIPSTIQCLETSALQGVETAVIGMAHRGRLNTLVNVCGKPLHQLLTQFNPISLEGFGSGDVKYHLGTHAERMLEMSKKKILVSVMANPSHLEAIDPVVVGRVRAEQVEKNDAKYGKKSVAILVHGDAAFSGQGIVYETMHLTNLPEYTTGGVIHLVINNQIGFTTDPRYSRSSAHCTDVARVVNAPILHIHADDPDLVTYCSLVAAEYRAVFHNDVVLDIVGYRRFGHNELDEPMLTQPLMYKRIKEHPNVLTIYSEKLMKEGVITEAYAKEEIQKYWDYCETEFQSAKKVDTMQLSDWHDVPWTDFFANQSPKLGIPPTGIDTDTIMACCKAISTPPRDISCHGQVVRVMDRRAQLLRARQADWAMGESLAYLSLLKEGHHVRLSGEDVERGTFSHRMHIIHDQNKDMTYKNILNNVFPGQALYTVSNSSLSEYGVCGFELGYSAYNHNTLTIWEGQFGDFANTCQVIIDSLLCSGQTKWGRQVGLVLLLPHGLEGQGPEHSSARIERFLELCDDDCVYLPGKEPGAPQGETVEQIMVRQLFEINWIICNITVPANIFHALRRQILMPFRKPLELRDVLASVKSARLGQSVTHPQLSRTLEMCWDFSTLNLNSAIALLGTQTIVMSPKSLLRHPKALSTFKDIETGTSFRPILPDPNVKPGNVQKVIICSGKVFYDIDAERLTRKLEDKIAIIRVEQLCPFPYQLLAQEVAKFPNAKIMWLQEEHKNQGAFKYARDRIALALGKKLEDILYGGRPTSSSPATGSKLIYTSEFKDVIETAMRLD